MALTVTYDDNAGGITNQLTATTGALRFVTGHFDFDSSYPTGGESLDLGTMLQGASLKAVFIESKSGYVFEYDYTNEKVKAMYADYAAAGPGALIQAPDLTNLSAVTDVRFFAVGV
jgi:hypothetical protein